MSSYSVGDTLVARYFNGRHDINMFVQVTGNTKGGNLRVAEVGKECSTVEHSRDYQKYLVWPNLRLTGRKFLARHNRHGLQFSDKATWSKFYCAELYNPDQEYYDTFISD